jgi:hypothetical protein
MNNVSSGEQWWVNAVFYWGLYRRCGTRTVVSLGGLLLRCTPGVSVRCIDSVQLT